MSTLLWTFHRRDFKRRNGMSLTNPNLNGTLSTSGAAASSPSYAPGFTPPSSGSNPQVREHLAPRAFNYTRGLSGSGRGANNCGNGQLGATGSFSQAGPREPSGAYAARQFHPENRQHSLQQRPLQQQKASSSSSTVTSERYKTELCRPFEESGICRYGNKCQFAHGSRELRTLSRHPKYKTEPCRTFHSIGFCPYGTRCHFIHNQQTYQAVLSGSTSAEQSSNNGCDAGPLGFNQEPKPRLQTVSSASASGLPMGHGHRLEAPVLVNQPKVNSGMHLSSSYPGATAPSTCCAAVAAASAAASAAAVFYRNGGVPCTTCANSTLVFGQGMGAGYRAPMPFQGQNLAAGNAVAYYHNQQQSQAAPGQFQLPMVHPPATASAPNAVTPMATAAIAPGATAGTFVSPGTTAAAVTAVPAETAGAHTGSATIANAKVAEGSAQPFNLQLPGAQSESLEFDVLTSNLDSLLGTHSFDNLLNCSSSFGSFNRTDSPNVQPSRRLPIFSHLSDSDM
ncbi:mRNA decay activator protein ZFP36L3 [Phodopus roborovskii]|uniref:mRNA decay activator protein ZFP36 n=1 Tax=Phodopus roborovskii TaxID=109678 RepID=A0AAU9YZW0_PHORO|nr:mRNA decay activator protein ZFP36L3 [Phodopus roborovskii]CAH6780027.1 LOC101825196 [Phodopus roborovskii]